jgi:hypothetical protein
MARQSRIFFDDEDFERSASSESEDELEELDDDEGAENDGRNLVGLGVADAAFKASDLPAGAGSKDGKVDPFDASVVGPTKDKDCEDSNGNVGT